MLYIYYPNYAIQFLASLLLQLSHFIFRWVSQSPLFSATSKKENGSRVTLAFVSQNIRSSQTAYCYTYGLLSAGATEDELPEGPEKVPWGMTSAHRF